MELEPVHQTDPTPPWIIIARTQIGVSEIPGLARHNPEILGYHAATSLGAKEDEVPWCSAFVNWCLQRAGLKGTRSARARSWLSWGESLTVPRYGCIVVMRRGLNPAQGHVGFFLGFVAPGRKFIRVLGGNQGDRVCGANFRSDLILGYRWPANWTPDGPATA